MAGAPLRMPAPLLELGRTDAYRAVLLFGGLAFWGRVFPDR
jgi:hypothetical protein